MKFSTSVLLSIALALAGQALAAPINSTAVEESSTENSVEFPFSEDSIISTVDLGDDVAPILANGTVYFVNTTIVDEELSSLTKRDADAEAYWHWTRPLKGQPLYKREAEADAEAWQWRKNAKGEPIYKREAEADAEAWQWRKNAKGEPIYKREAEADAEAWQWRKNAKGEPIYKREAEPEAWQWRKNAKGEPIYKREAEADAEADAEAWQWRKNAKGEPIY